MTMTKLTDDEYVISDAAGVSSKIVMDDIVASVIKSFDYEFDGVSNFTPTKLDIKFPYNIGLIVGPSGSGKSTTLASFGEVEDNQWDSTKAICSHFENFDDACGKLNACGLSSIPQWVKPYHALSNGEKFRADLARQLKDNSVIDEFTSVVNRDVAKSASSSISKYIKKNNIQSVVFASCHYDIIEWLQPDWVYDTSTKKFHRGSLRQPSIEIKLVPCSTKNWSMFAKFHYLSHEISPASTCWIAMWGDVIVGFTSIIPFPHGSIKNGWREHRTVVIPDFQGLGIGSRISDTIGQWCVDTGKQYYAKTAHVKLSNHRNRSDLWKLVVDNGDTSNLEGRMRMRRSDYTLRGNMLDIEHVLKHESRPTTTHKFVGRPNSTKKITL
jgi:GNAT superfamily N-acetyltransferase